MRTQRTSPAQVASYHRDYLISRSIYLNAQRMSFRQEVQKIESILDVQFQLSLLRTLPALSA